MTMRSDARMKNKTKLFLLIATLGILSGAAAAIGNFRTAGVWYATAANWGATGADANRGIRWDTSTDTPIAHQNSGTELAMTLPSQTGNNGKLLTTDGTNASWLTVGGLSLGNFLFASNTESLSGASTMVLQSN